MTVYLKKLNGDTYEFYKEVDVNNPAPDVMELFPDGFFEDATEQDVLAYYDGPMIIADRQK